MDELNKDVPVLKFVEDFPKLGQQRFRTIRKYDKKQLKPGTIVKCKSPNNEFLAMVVCKSQSLLWAISDEELMKDTNTKSRMDAVDLLNRYYNGTISEEGVVTVLHLKKVTHG